MSKQAHGGKKIPSRPEPKKGAGGISQKPRGGGGCSRAGESFLAALDGFTTTTSRTSVCAPGSGAAMTGGAWQIAGQPGVLFVTAAASPAHQRRLGHCMVAMQEPRAPWWFSSGKVALQRP